MGDLHALSDCYVSGFSSSSYDAQFVSADAQSPARGARSRPHGVSSGQPVVLWSSLYRETAAKGLISILHPKRSLVYFYYVRLCVQGGGGCGMELVGVGSLLFCESLVSKLSLLHSLVTKHLCPLSHFTASQGDL